MKRKRSCTNWPSSIATHSIRLPICCSVLRENRQHRPGISGAKFNSFHLSATVSVSAFDESGRRFGVIAWFQKHDVLFCILPSYLDSAQQLRGLVAAHGPYDEFQFAWHTSLQHLQSFVLTWHDVPRPRCSASWTRTAVAAGSFKKEYSDRVLCSAVYNVSSVSFSVDCFEV